MTTNPSCRDVERLFLAAEGRKLGTAERRLVDDHLRACERCRAFAADRAFLREELAAIRWPAPADELVRRTRRLVRETASDEARTRPVPGWVLSAMALVAIVTGLWLAVALAGVTPETTLADLPLGGLAAVIIVIQNALMLLFTPVILRTVRARRGAPQSV